jgi:hypothetical protein
MLRLPIDGLQHGTFDPAIHPVVILLSMMALGGPGQLLRKVAAERGPFSDVPSGKALAEQMLGIFLNGVGKKPAGGHS